MNQAVLTIRTLSLILLSTNQTGYDNCTMDGVASNWTSGKDFIPLPEARRYYLCGNGFCLQGMKVTITVHPLPHNASAEGKSHGITDAAEEDSHGSAQQVDERRVDGGARCGRDCRLVSQSDSQHCLNICAICYHVSWEALIGVD
jgi:hypothetical protein